ncbi:MAG: aminotransferase class I/II-fold pyridoxal phosphate-dependent enzyme [Actinobacteria bacterium]|nr:aminotransferase class I/II-fold pyridoxal phosphate-dependent enzyme [Actinomycetota bacterium]
MAEGVVSARMDALAGSMSGLMDFLDDPVMQGVSDPDAADFVFGNPHDDVLPEFWQALQRWSKPKSKDWFAYKLNEQEATQVVAGYLTQARDRPWPAERVLMTNGAFAGLAVSLNALVDAGDEVIYTRPPWFFYEALVRSVGAQPVEIEPAADFNLDLDSVAAGLTDKTRAIIINSPNNPTGRIYPAGVLERLSQILREGSARAGRPIYLLSDEAYNRILFDGRRFPSPTDHYDHSLLLYTYGKTLLTPGQRLGYIALSPEMLDAEQVYESLFLAQTLCGWAFPSALMQHALADIQKLSIDVDNLERKRDRMITGLREAGYGTNLPEGTFYLLVKSPTPDDAAFCRRLAKKGVFVLPGQAFGMPGYFRISLTASEKMIDKALPVFAEVTSTAAT